MSNIYDWMSAAKTGQHTGAATTGDGNVNQYGLHNRSGVHTSELAQGTMVRPTGAAATGSGARMQASAYFSDMFLERKRLKGEDLVFANYAQKRSIPKGNNTINLRGYKSLAAHTVPLVEGNPPAPDKASGYAIQATTRQYGRYMEFTDVFKFKVADPIIEEYTVELSDVANETIDLLAQSALLAEAQLFFAKKTDTATGKPTGTRVSTLDKLIDQGVSRPTVEDLRIITLTMKAAKVKPIGRTYTVLASPAVLFDLYSDPEVDKWMHNGKTNAPQHTGLIPDMFDLHFVEAVTAKQDLETSKATNKATVHHTIVLGAKAYSRIEIEGEGNTQFFTKELGSAGTIDPINQRQTMGFKINSIGFKVTDPDAVIDYLSIPTQAAIVSNDFADVPFNTLGTAGVTKEMLDQAIATSYAVKADGTAIEKSTKIATFDKDTKTAVQAGTAIQAELEVGQFGVEGNKAKLAGADNESNRIAVDKTTGKRNKLAVVTK